MHLLQTIKENEFSLSKGLQNKFFFFCFISSFLKKIVKHPKVNIEEPNKLGFFYNRLPFPISFQHIVHIVHILLFNNYWMVCIPMFLMPFFHWSYTNLLYFSLIIFLNKLISIFSPKEVSYDHGTLDLIWEISLSLPMMSHDLLFNILF